VGTSFADLKTEKVSGVWILSSTWDVSLIFLVGSRTCSWPLQILAQRGRAVICCKVCIHVYLHVVAYSLLTDVSGLINIQDALIKVLSCFYEVAALIVVAGCVVVHLANLARDEMAGLGLPLWCIICIGKHATYIVGIDAHVGQARWSPYVG
jgi:hypothetical protein